MSGNCESPSGFAPYPVHITQHRVTINFIVSPPPSVRDSVSLSLLPIENRLHYGLLLIRRPLIGVKTPLVADSQYSFRKSR